VDVNTVFERGKTEGIMRFDKKEVIDKLKLELEILEKGGYAPSVREPHWAPRLFRDSVSCPNLGLEIKVEPCSSCFLMEFVPPEHRDKEDACHYIPLNERGETAASLGKTGDSERLQDALRLWLQKTIFRLAESPELTTPAEEEPPRLLLSSGGRPCPLQRPEGRISSS
jgi:hypothetical protein